MLPNRFVDELPAGLPIGDQWRATDQTREVIFPFDGTVVGRAPVGSTQDAADALDAAWAAQSAMAEATVAQRRGVLRRIHTELSARGDDLIDLLVLETGKPLVDCRTEVARALATWEAALEEVARLVGETVPLDLQPLGKGMLGYFTREPAGVVVGIAGFNYPLLLASHKAAPALAAGCPIIVKPAPNTPLATLWMADVARQALVAEGLPAAGLQLVTGDVAVGATLVGDERVPVVSFTGSAEVGHQIARNAAPRKALLELGSNTAVIVAADADLDAAVDGVIRGGFYANGQACISIQRLLVHRDVVDEFVGRLLRRLPEVVVGDPRTAQTRLAPVIDDRSRTRIREWLAAAVAAGAEVIAGEDGASTEVQMQPTVVRDVPHDQPLWAEEIFGPVVCVEAVCDVEDAIAIANASRYGLQGAIYTGSLQLAFDAINRFDVGGVVVNEIPGFRSDVMPYGGVKDSGVGREGPRWAMEEFTVTKMAMIRP